MANILDPQHLGEGPFRRRNDFWDRFGAFLFAILGIIALIAATQYIFRPATASGPSSNRVLNYQLRLTDASGIPVADGTKNIFIKFYDASTAGTMLHSDCDTTGTPVARKIIFTNGIGSVLIGDTTADSTHNCTDAAAPDALPATLFSTATLYMGIQKFIKNTTNILRSLTH